MQASDMTEKTMEFYELRYGVLKKIRDPITNLSVKYGFTCKATACGILKYYGLVFS